MSSPRLVTVLVVLGFAGFTWAQDVASGPERGADLPALKVFDATGPHQGQEVNYAAERKGKPTVYLFIQADKWDRPMARFVRTLDEAVQKDDAFVVAVWLTDDVDKAKQYLPLAQQSLQLQKTALTCFPGERAGPQGWNINADAHLTAVVSKGPKAERTFGYQSLNETNVPEVRAALKK